MRNMIIKHPKNNIHTDSHRGNYYSYERWDDEGGELTVWQWPVFTRTVVEFAGVLFVPMKLTGCELIMYGIDYKDPKKVKKYKFSNRMLEVVKPYGFLEDVSILGTIQGKLCYYHLSEGYKEYKAPRELPVTSIGEVLELVKMNRQFEKPRFMKRVFSEPKVWHKFKGTWYAHQYTGDPSLRRSNVFYHPIRQVCTGTGWTVRDEEIAFTKESMTTFIAKFGSHFDVKLEAI